MYYAGSKRKLGKKPIANIFFFTPNESSEDHSEAESTILENQDRRINKILCLVLFVSVV